MYSPDVYIVTKLVSADDPKGTFEFKLTSNDAKEQLFVTAKFASKPTTSGDKTITLTVTTRAAIGKGESGTYVAVGDAYIPVADAYVAVEDAYIPVAEADAYVAVSDTYVAVSDTYVAVGNTEFDEDETYYTQAADGSYAADATVTA